MAESSLELLISPEEAARRLGLGQVVKDPKRTVLAMARRGELRAVRVGKFTMIDPSTIERVVAGR